MKKFLLFGLIAAVLPALAEEASDRKTATSLKYVTHELDTRQNKFGAEQNKAMEYTDSAGTVQKRTVTSDLGSSTTDTSLPMVGGVNSKLNQKQDDIDPFNDHTAVTYTGTVGTIGQKGIYQTTESYAEQSDNLIDAKTFNAALKNGLDNEFKCRDYKPDTNLCWVYSIHNNIGDGSLPPEYTQLEYIESTGTQWIDTEIYPSDSTTTQVDFQYTELRANDTIFGANTQNAVEYYGLGLAHGTQWRLWYGSGGSPWVVFGDADTNKHRVVLTDRKIYFDGATVPSATSRLTLTSPSSRPITLFAYNYRDTAPVSYFAKAKIFGVVIKQGQETVRNMVPAKHGNTIGMYDTINNRFFENAGDGDDFTAGPELNVYIPQNQ